MNKISKYIPPLLILASIVAGIIVYPQMPDTVVSHWGPTGQPDGYMNKFWGIFILPIILIIIYIMLIIIPRLDPNYKNIEKFRPQFDNFIAMMCLFLTYIYALLIAWNLGYIFEFVYFMIPALAIFFYSLGSLIENSRHNFTIGIRTPWTLASEHVWEKTHILGGKMFRYSAVLILLSMIWKDYAFIIFIVIILAITFYLTIYSYLLYRKEKAV